MQLCRVCNPANGDRFPEGKCYICGDAALKTDAMLEEAVAILSQEKPRSFSISTLIPKDWLSREEKAWDVALEDAESIKNLLNRRISSSLTDSVKADYVPQGDCRVIFDYKNGKVTLERNPLFIFGRYRKHKAGLSQSRWRCVACKGKGCRKCDGKGKFYESVEERIGEPFKEAARADDYVMHASGREDVDATNSAGRPFIMELKNPKARGPHLTTVAKKIAAGKEVSVADLRFVHRSFSEIVTESHFDKTYEAEVQFEKELDEDSIAKILSLNGKTILQKTPKRVAHRRANLVRHRKVKSIEVKDAKGNHATIVIKAEAGTYIKELISSDDGRTNPSITGLLGFKAECKKLDVSDIDDGFMDFCLQ